MRNYFYDFRGNLLTVTSPLSGVVQMARTTNTIADADAGAGAAPTGNPPNASANGTVTLATFTPDPAGTGNVMRIQQASTSRCQDIAYDVGYSQLPAAKTTYVGGCGSPGGLTTLFDNYVRGFGAVTDGSTPDGQETKVQYDYMGRPVSITRSDSSVPAMLEGFAAVTFTYADTVVPRSVHKSTTDGTRVHDLWTVLDGYGRPLLSATSADTSAGDAAQWIVAGQHIRNAKGAIAAQSPPSFQADWTTVSLTAGSSAATFRYDPFGRVLAANDIDGTPILARTYGALSYSEQDAEQLKQAGVVGQPAPHAGLSSTLQLDGHGRMKSLTRQGNGGSVTDLYTYLPAGELWVLDRNGSDSTGSYAYERWMQYDSLGRMVFNAEPSATTGFVVVGGATSSWPSAPPATMEAWTYAYDDAGDLVATTDARGCGENLTYDGAGRPLSEDYFRCTPTQLPYSAPNPATGAGAEVLYTYDSAGRRSDVYDRGAHTHYGYDGRSRITSVGKNLAQPHVVPTPTSGYAPHTFWLDFLYDDFDRVTGQTTGEDIAITGLNGASVPFGATTSTSAVTVNYSKRGVVTSVGGSYGPLIRQTVFDADGLPRETSWGDVAPPSAGSQWQAVPGTQTTQTYDPRRRLAEWTVARGAPSLWTSGAGGYTPPVEPPITTTQTVLADEVYTNDGVGNPLSIHDGRISGEWPAAWQPVSRGPIGYDDFYRVTSVPYTYAGANLYESPSPAPTPAADPLPLQTAGTRIGSETFSYDPFGNPQETMDNLGLFFDRSLGSVNVGVSGDMNTEAVSSTNQVVSASLNTSSGLGQLQASYDAAGNLEQLAVVRTGPCASPDGCKQLFHYEWDEVGHLAHAQRFDFLPAPPKCTAHICPGIPSPPPPKDGDPLAYVYPATPPFSPGADATYGYGGDGNRTLRTSLQSDGSETYTVVVFGSLRLNDTTFGTQDPGDYDRSAETDSVYLVAGGVSVGRVVYATGDPATPNGMVAGQHVFLELGDGLGSTTSVIDQGTGELVERTTYTSHGAVESDYWTERWQEFREQYKFTGKEDDVALGMTYFGARYYSPYLGTWMSPDPLAIHGLGGDLNPYAYVHGRVTTAIDPMGLCDGSIGTEQCPSGGDDDGWSLEYLPSELNGIGTSFSDIGKDLLGLFQHGPVPRPMPVNPGNNYGEPIYSNLFSVYAMQHAEVDWGAVKAFNDGINKHSTVIVLTGGVAIGEAGVLAVTTGGAAFSALGDGYTAADTALGTAARGIGNAAGNGMGYVGRTVVVGAGALLGANNAQEEETVAQETVTLWRGVTSTHPGFADATEGTAYPRGGLGSVFDHNLGETETEWTSWTSDEGWARAYATRGGVPGIILEVKVLSIGHLPLARRIRGIGVLAERPGLECRAHLRESASQPIGADNDNRRNTTALGQSGLGLRVGCGVVRGGAVGRAREDRFPVAVNTGERVGGHLRGSARRAALARSDHGGSRRARDCASVEALGEVDGGRSLGWSVLGGALHSGRRVSHRLHCEAFEVRRVPRGGRFERERRRLGVRGCGGIRG